MMNIFNDKFLKYKTPVSIIFACITGILLIVIIFQVFIKEDAEKHYLHTQMDSIQKQITQLSDTSNTPDFRSSFSGIRNELMTIKNQENSNAKSTDLEKISAQINVIKQAIDELKTLVVDSGNGKEFLESKVLPFQVISVDVISQQPFVSIEYDHHITPLGIGDTIAGWQITEADYAASQVEFKNNKNQYVKIRLQG